MGNDLLKVYEKYTSTSKVAFNGLADEMVKLVERVQLKDKELWDLVCEQFSEYVDDADNGWRCEYWGKLMRGSCVVYSYTNDVELYTILEKAVKSLISHADAEGRIATYSKEKEFHGWDMWGRKYVLLGLIHFYEICADEQLKELVLTAAKGQLDYIIKNIGSGDGKKEITKTSDFWCGINSSSILEPVVRLYNICGNKTYIDFAEYIVNRGGAEGFDIFEAAYEDKLYPYEYPVEKAYELMSCFEGLLEYYKVTGNEKYKTAVINFVNRVIESEITIIGSAGCKHELFNNSSLMQTYTKYSGLMQETCVTVTWIKLCRRLLLLTGESKYADEIERSVYNALYGAVNTQNSKCSDEATFDLDADPEFYKKVYRTHHIVNTAGQIFDSYSPLRRGIRGRAVGGFKPMRNNTRYCGCCIAIGAVGVGMVPQTSVLTGNDEFVFMMYLPGKAMGYTNSGKRVEFNIKTEYPSNGKVQITVLTQYTEEFTVSLRIPSFAESSSVSINGKERNGVCSGEMFSIKRKWNNGDIIELNIDMNLRIERGKYNDEDSDSDKHIAILYGPIVLARDRRTGLIEPLKGTLDSKPDISCADTNLGKICNFKVKLGGNEFIMIDYASSGKTWDSKSETEAWLRFDGDFTKQVQND